MHHVTANRRVGTSVLSSQSLARFTTALALMGCLPGHVLPLEAQTDPQWLSERMSSWYQRALRTSPGEWGIAVADQSGQMLWRVKPDQPLMPASTVKLFTTGFAR